MKNNQEFNVNFKKNEDFSKKIVRIKLKRLTKILSDRYNLTDYLSIAFSKE